MDWHRKVDKPLPEPMIDQLNENVRMIQGLFY